MNHLIGILAPLINSLLLVFIMVISIKSSRSTWGTLKMLSKRISHIYAVLDILIARPGTPPVLRSLYAMDPDKMPADRKGRMAMMSKMQLEMYQDVRKNLTAMLDMAPEPQQKEKLKIMIQEFDSMATVLSTVDENSSEQYIEQVTNEIPATVARIVQKLTEFEAE